ncbi:MAG: HAD domain-containing protein [Coriobacteriales bacterium]|nr:HAD domain-containing protein [Coriobacteriales bacterium]
MKAIFLDIDGVIATPDTMIANFEQNREPHEMQYDQLAMNNLGAIVAVTGAIVVLSSSWRADLNSGSEYVDAIVNNLLDQLSAAGAPISDATPMIGGADRSTEIGAWLDEHPCEAYAIIDDLARFEQRPEIAEGHLVLVEDSNGIRASHVAQALRILR